MQLHPIEGNGNSNNVNSVDIEAAGVGEDGDEDMLLHVEGPRVQGEGPAREGNLEGRGGQRRRHKFAEGEHHNLGRNRGDVERVLPVAKELVEEGEECTRGEAKDPSSEGENW